MSIIHRALDRNIHLLKPSQPLSGRWAKELDLKFQEALDRGAEQVIVDLEHVPFVDCTGLAVLVRGYKAFGSNQQNFHLTALQDQPKLLLELTMFDRIFPVFDSVGEAMGAHPSQQPQLRQPVAAFAAQPV